jgi:hypothetical protein
MELNVPLPAWHMRSLIVWETDMPIILWLLGVPAIVVIALVVTHVI